jgi:hypothetical protein
MAGELRAEAPFMLRAVRCVDYVYYQVFLYYMRQVRRLLFYTLCGRVRILSSVLLYLMRSVARFEYFIVLLARVF